jgi:MYXO-CTERM domain-containing protein
MRAARRLALATAAPRQAAQDLLLQTRRPMRTKILSSLFFVTTLGVAAPAFAQPSDTGRSSDTQSDNGNNDRSGLWGLVGLLGGLGLLGLRRRHEGNADVRRVAPAGGY